MASLFKRDDCYRYADGDERCYNSAWDNWARWLVLALIVIAAFLLFFALSCVSARRRRKLGHSPYRGTGWALGRTPPGHNAPSYNQQPYYQNAQPYYNNSNNPPPAYTAPPNGGYYGNGANSGYYNNDVELQQPQPVYGSGEGGKFNPPAGPPPSHRA